MKHGSGSVLEVLAEALREGRSLKTGAIPPEETPGRSLTPGSPVVQNVPEPRETTSLRRQS